MTDWGDIVVKAGERVRPLPGFVWCELVPDSVTRYVPGLGNIKIEEIRSGLIIPKAEEKMTDSGKGRLLVVRTVGGEPEEWTNRYFEKERRWEASFEQQKIGEGTLLLVRQVAGLSAGRKSEYFQVRWDEVCAIGRPVDEDGVVDMLPAPGWIALLPDELPDEVGASGLYVRSEVRAALADTGGLWCRVMALARGCESGYDGLGVGDRVLVPRLLSGGATEYVIAGGFRYVPYDDVFAVEEAA